MMEPLATSGLLSADDFGDYYPPSEPWGLGVMDVRPGQPLPSEAEDDSLSLSADELQEFSQEFGHEIDAYDEMAGGRIARWDEIEEAYDCEAGPESATRSPEGDALVSEMMMSLVDQGAARIQNALSRADPLPSVRPEKGRGAEAAQWAADAESAQHLLNNSTKRQGSLRNLLPIICHRTAKLGTSVVLAEWRVRSHEARWYDNFGRLTVEPQRIGEVHYRLIENRDVVVWPTRCADWQEAEIVGHWATYSSPSAWRAKAAELGLEEREIQEIETWGIETTRPEEASLSATFEPVRLGMFYCYRTLPGKSEPQRFIVYYHRESGRVLKLLPNESAEQRHPYFPLRWKLTDRGAWGDGIGDEVLSLWTQDSALANLVFANLLAGAFWVNRVTPGSYADITMDDIRPGSKVRAAAGEFEPMKMGGEAPEVHTVREDVRYSSREATGLASVLAGMGDPIQKSGTGTGATHALIEQAGQKFEVIGDRITLDLEPLYAYTLELIFRYAPEGVVYSIVSGEDAAVVETFHWVPPRRRPSEILHVSVEIPSAANSSEARKMHYLAMFNFSATLVKTLDEMVGQALAQENLPAYMRWKKEWAAFLVDLSKRVVEHHDLPGLSQKIPILPEPQPAELVIAQLQQRTAELEGQLQQATQPQMPMQMPMQGVM